MTARKAAVATKRKAVKQVHEKIKVAKKANKVVKRGKGGRLTIAPV